jgi:trehalose 6-phosphate synthase/phosphatase
MSRLIIVSNRLPVTVVNNNGVPEIVPSPGGLSTGLKGPHERSNGLWIGWPGELSEFTEEQREEIHKRLLSMKLIPVYLTPVEIQSYYERFSNGIIWPLFHYLLDNIPYDPESWESYDTVNRKFADVVGQHATGEDLIWVHDYQLFMVPYHIRKFLPTVKIGFFLHIPFPSSEVFRILPFREKILDGMLGADLIGFHTFPYMRHFSSCLIRISGKEPAIDRVFHEGRSVSFGIFPISVDAKHIHEMSLSAEVLREVKRLRELGEEEFVLLGVDRLDYTKGIPRRLYAIAKFFEKYPQYRGRVRMVQIAVPTRENVEAYHNFRSTVNELVGEINGKYGTVSSTPVHYLHRAFDAETIVGLYRAADVMLVTPLRDGMNLVAKEFIASRSDEDGVLILSEFAGAASELGEALIVNPYDIDGMAEAIRQAIEMRKRERSIRMRAMRGRVFSQDVHAWAQSFIERLGGLKTDEHIELFWEDLALARFLSLRKGKEELTLLLDYDGTLVPFQNRPELATPDDELLNLMERLGRSVHLNIISGRKRETLEEWFGSLPVGLYAEHGLWKRVVGGEWTPLIEIRTEWKETVRATLEEFTRSTPGSLIEEKTASLAWHYRAAEKEFGSLQARELRLHLLESYSNIPVHILRGNKVVEIRMTGVNKGLAVNEIVRDTPAGQIVAVGDDPTDEDMFAAVPENGICIRVGHGETVAGYRLRDHRAVRGFIRNLIQLL